MHLISQLNRAIISTTSNGHSGTGLAVRFPGAADRDALTELAQRSNQPVPSGSVIVAEQDGKVIAAVPLNGGTALAEATPEAEAAVAVLRFRIHQLRDGAVPAWVWGNRRTPVAA